MPLPLAWGDYAEQHKQELEAAGPQEPAQEAPQEAASEAMDETQG